MAATNQSSWHMLNSMFWHPASTARLLIGNLTGGHPRHYRRLIPPSSVTEHLEVNTPAPPAAAATAAAALLLPPLLLLLLLLLLLMMMMMIWAGDCAGGGCSLGAAFFTASCRYCTQGQARSQDTRAAVETPWTTSLPPCSMHGAALSAVILQCCHMTH
jgi:hypothetical protein